MFTLLPLFAFFLIFSSQSIQAHRVMTCPASDQHCSTLYLMGCSVGRQETVVGIFAYTKNHLSLLHKITKKTREIDNFSNAIKNILDDLHDHYGITVQHACFGVPGNPSAHQDFIQPFHISFAVDAQTLLQLTDLQSVKVVNDFEVIGYGINDVPQHTIIQLNAGVPREWAPKAVVGAGGGVGSSLMVYDACGGDYRSLPLGFCYVDFAAHTPQEVELADFIRHATQGDNVSWGKILGGTGGIMKMYEFLSLQQTVEPGAFKPCGPQDIFDASAINPVCKDAVMLYMNLYIRLIRNIVYATLPYGGIYLTNTVAEENSGLFTTPAFLEELWNCDNKVLTAIIRAIPVYLITDPNVKLYGAARYLVTTLKPSML